MTTFIKMLEDIISKAERGEIICGAVQYVDSDGKYWLSSRDGNIEIPLEMLDDAQANYSRLTGKGN